MRSLTAIMSITLAALLAACDQRHPAADIDPELGLKCFESLRSSLPPGTQYEGIDKLDDNHITIKIMNGVEVVTMDCTLNPDGKLK